MWINPDGFRWIEVLRDESKLELTFNPSPTWSETNWFMDYILPVGLSGERHDQHSEPTNTQAWVGFRQPVLRVALEKSGWQPKDPARATLEAHVKAGLGEIWEENELWVNLLFHHVDPDGSLGIKKFWESRERPGNPVTIAEYYNAAFGTLPGLRKAAAEAANTKEAEAKSDLERQLAAFAKKYPNYDFLRDRGAWTENLASFRGDSKLSTWLYQVARSFCTKQRRRHEGEPAEHAALEDVEARRVVSDSTGPDARTHARQVGEVIQAALATLPIEQREAIVLRDVEGLSTEEAADVVGIEVYALKSRLHRARMSLKQSLAAVLDDDGTELGCEGLRQELSSYAASEIDQAACAHIEEHLQTCAQCSAACESLKRTVSMCRSIPGGEVPITVRTAVRRALLRH